MSILIGESTRIMVQGITGRDGSFHVGAMARYGATVVGGVTPGKGGAHVGPLPVFGSVKEACDATQANCSVVFVPAQSASAAIREAIDCRIPIIVCITEGIPVLETIENCRLARENDVCLIGPNCPGLITPGKSLAGIMPGFIHLPGAVGVISRSGTLTYEVVNHLTVAGWGQSTCVGIGGDPVIGTGAVELLELFEADAGTEAVVLIGEIGGEEEESAARFIAHRMTKRVVAFIAGKSAPEGKRMGHAGAIVSGGAGTAQAKIDALQNAGAVVVDRPDLIPGALKRK